MARVRDFSVIHSIQTVSVVHRASYPVGTGGYFPRGMRPMGEADHSSPSAPEIYYVWSCTSTPQHIFMAWLLIKHRDNFILYSL
jgi:hypothetical protein